MLMVCHCRYQLLEIDSPRKVVFFGISRFHESTDTVTFNRKAGQNDVVEVEYTTDIELVRWYKYVLMKSISQSACHVPVGQSACHALVNNVCLDIPFVSCRSVCFRHVHWEASCLQNRHLALNKS